MKVWRAMSIKEFQLFNAGVTIRGRCNFSNKRNGYKLDRGVCFFLDANNCAHWGGEVICCFYIPARNLEKSFGAYPNLFSGDWGSMVECEEFALPHYSKNNAVLLAYGFANSEKHEVEMYGHYNISNQRIYAGYTEIEPKVKFNANSFKKIRKIRGLRRWHLHKS